MTSQTKTLAESKSENLPIVMSVLLGLAILVIAGHVQADSLHNAAHDVRHATGFPCH